MEASVISDGLSGELGEALLAEDIKPGDSVGYETAKRIFEYHPLGGKLAEHPVVMAMSQEREYSIPDAPEEDCIKQFLAARDEIGADAAIRMTATLSRVYGISALVVGTEGVKTNEPLTIENLRSEGVYLNCADPLNAAGSLVLNQDATAPDFLKPRGVTIGGDPYHKSRSAIILNEIPIFLGWTASAFGFSGRSVYQRTLYPLKAYLEAMIAARWVAQKCGTIVAKVEQNSSAANQIAARFLGQKRMDVKLAKTGNVISVGQTDAVESLDLTNIGQVLETALTEIREMIAAGAGMPAQLVNQQTFADGFGEGTEDAKAVAGYIEAVRKWMAPLYALTDKIAMARAWTPEFYTTIQSRFPSYANVPYQTAFQTWCGTFTARWPSLLREPESKLVEVDKVKFEAVISAANTLMPNLDPDNRARVLMWVQDCLNSTTHLIPSRLDLDAQGVMDWLAEQGALLPDAGLARSEAVPLRLGR